jgi:hypothetical protein
MVRQGLLILAAAAAAQSLLLIAVGMEDLGL